MEHVDRCKSLGLERVNLSFRRKCSSYSWLCWCLRHIVWLQPDEHCNSGFSASSNSNRLNSHLHSRKLFECSLHRVNYSSLVRHIWAPFFYELQSPNQYLDCLPRANRLWVVYFRIQSKKFLRWIGSKLKRNNLKSFDDLQAWNWNRNDSKLDLPNWVKHALDSCSAHDRHKPSWNFDNYYLVCIATASVAGLRQFNLNQLVRPKLCWYNYCHYIESYGFDFWLARYEYFQRVNLMLRYNYIWLYDCELRLRARLLSNWSCYSFHQPEPSLWWNNFIHVEHDPLICVNSRKHSCYLQLQFEWSGNFRRCCNSKSKHKWHHYLVPILNCFSQLHTSQLLSNASESCIELTVRERYSYA